MFLELVKCFDCSSKSLGLLRKEIFVFCKEERVYLNVRRKVFVVHPEEKYLISEGIVAKQY